MIWQHSTLTKLDALPTMRPHVFVRNVFEYARQHSGFDSPRPAESMDSEAVRRHGREGSAFQFWD